MTAKYVFRSTQNCIKCFGAIPNNKEQTGHRTFQMHSAFSLFVTQAMGEEYKSNSHQLQPKGEGHPHTHAVQACVRAQSNPGRDQGRRHLQAPLGKGPGSDMCAGGKGWRMGEGLHFLRLSIIVCMFNIQHFGGSEGTKPPGRPSPGSGINDQHDLEQHT